MDGLLWGGTALEPEIWFILGCVLLVLELATPGVYLLWIGLAALTTATLTYFFAASLTIQILLFVFLGFIFLGIGITLFHTPASERYTSHVNQRAESLIGTILTLEEDMLEPKLVYIKHDTRWVIQCPPGLRMGQKIIITQVLGTRLIAEKYPPEDTL